jgi:hypothetical protein
MSKATTLEAATEQRQANVVRTVVGFTFEAIPPVRELDHRHSAGIDVSLVWDARTDQVAVALRDERSGEALSFVVDPTEALSAFHHPYAYAAHPSFGKRHPGGVVTQ